MDKPTNDEGEIESVNAIFQATFDVLVREAEKASPAIPVAPVAPSRYKGPPKLVLIQGGLSTK